MPAHSGRAPHPIRHIVFDCDGVLVDSELISSELEDVIAQRLGITVPAAEMHRRFLGRTAREQWRSSRTNSGSSCRPTFTPAASTRLKVAGILHHFGDRTISYEEVARPKPAPDTYRKAVTRSGLPVSETVVIEDTRTGASAAIAAGIRVIGFIGGEHATPEMARGLKEIRVSTIVEDFRTLPGVISGL